MLRLIAVKISVPTAGRFASALAVAAALVIPATGCASASDPRPAAARDRAVVTADFSGMGLAFKYPATWRSGTWSDASSFSALIVDLSTSRLHNPCHRITRPGVITGSCGFPVSKLPPGGVLVTWSDFGNPVMYLPKSNTIVGGRRALENVTSGGWCATLGGDTTISVTMPWKAANWYEMNACLRGPGLAQQEAEISSMLKSVHISSGY